MQSHPNPEAAETAFYTAIEDANLDSMMSVWDTSEDIVCIHPLGPRLQGSSQIRQSWQRIFDADKRLRFQIGAIHALNHGNLVVRMVCENITVLGEKEQPAQPILATNIYRYGPTGWRMVLHHASPGTINSGSFGGQHGWLH